LKKKKRVFKENREKKGLSDKKRKKGRGLKMTIKMSPRSLTKRNVVINSNTKKKANPRGKRGASSCF